MNCTKLHDDGELIAESYLEAISVSEDYKIVTNLFDMKQANNPAGFIAFIADIPIVIRRCDRHGENSKVLYGNVGKLVSDAGFPGAYLIKYFGPGLPLRTAFTSDLYCKSALIAMRHVR